jgi:hypothetical protein
MGRGSWATLVRYRRRRRLRGASLRVTIIRHRQEGVPQSQAPLSMTHGPEHQNVNVSQLGLPRRQNHEPKPLEGVKCLV